MPADPIGGREGPVLGHQFREAISGCANEATPVKLPNTHPGPYDVIANWAEDKRWIPSDEQDERARLYRQWKKAVTKTFDWVDEDSGE